MQEYLVKCGLFFNGYVFDYIVLILGLSFFDRKKFSFILASFLFIIVVGQMLKFIWQVPLNVMTTGHQGFAYPSGHTLAAVSLWLLICIEFHKKWLIPIAFIVVCLGVYAIVQKGYHDWLEIIGGFAAAGLCVALVKLAEERMSKGKLYGLYTLLSAIIYSILLLRSPFSYFYLLQCIGLIMAITLLHQEIFNFETKIEKIINCLVIGSLLFFCQKIKVNIWPFNDFTLLVEWSLLGAMIFFVVPLTVIKFKN